MKDKLINIKNFLRIVICCFVIFNFAKSCAHASVNYNDFISFNYTGDNMDLVNQACEEILGYSFDTLPTNPGYYTDVRNTAVNRLESSSFPNIYIETLPNTRVVFYMSNNSQFVGSYTCWSYSIYYDNRNGWIVRETNYNNSNLNVNGNLSTGISGTCTNKYLCADGIYFYGRNSYYIPSIISPLRFVFHDTSRTSLTPSGQTATCVFLNPLASFQNIGYLEDYESVKNDSSFSCSIFGLNYRNPDNVQVGSIGDNNWYFDDSGNLWVSTGTMWSRLVYEISGGSYLQQRSFDTFYYIAAGSNFSGDPRFYSGDNFQDNNGLEDDPSFNLWKTIGSFFYGSGDGSGDGSFGIVGGIGNLFKVFFIPDQTQLHNFIESKISVVGPNTGEVLSKPSVVFGLLLNKMYSSGDFIIDIPTLSLPGSFVYGSQSNNPDVVIYNGESLDSQINFTQLVQNEPYKTIYDYYIVIISGVYLFLFFAYLWSLWDHFMHSREIDYTLSDINRRL